MKGIFYATTRLPVHGGRKMPLSPRREIHTARPRAAPDESSEARPTLLWTHGGGWWEASRLQGFES